MEFLRKFWKWLILIFIVPLAISYITFAFEGFISPGLIERNDWLTFWSGFLAFYGAIFLGFVAFWQNSKANEVNQRLLNLEVEAKKGNYSYLFYKDADMLASVHKKLENPVTYQKYKELVEEHYNSKDFILSKTIVLWENLDSSYKMETNKLSDGTENPRFIESFESNESCEYAQSFTIDFFAVSSNEFLVSKIEVSGIYVVLPHDDGHYKAVWFGEKPVSLSISSNAIGMRDGCNHSFRVHFKLYTTRKHLFSHKNKKGMNVAFNKIRYTNIVGVTTECYQSVSLSCRKMMIKYCHLVISVMGRKSWFALTT